MIHEQQAGALRILAGVEDNFSAGAVRAGAGISGGDLGGAAGELCASGDVEGVQALMICAGGILRHADDKDCAIRSGAAIDDRGGSDADLRRDLAAAVIVAGGFVGAEHGGLPKLRAGVGIEGVDAVVFGGDKHDILRLPGDGEVSQDRAAAHRPAPSTARTRSKPNLVEVTLAGVRAVSLGLRPVRPMSSW